MPKASELAVELRKFAEMLDRNPEAEINRCHINFSHYGKAEKDNFFRLVKLMPKPLAKSAEYDYLKVKYSNDVVHLYAEIPQSESCTLITPAQPAKYDCGVLLGVHDVEDGELDDQTVSPLLKPLADAVAYAENELKD